MMSSITHSQSILNIWRRGGLTALSPGGGEGGGCERDGDALQELGIKAPKGD